MAFAVYKGFITKVSGSTIAGAEVVDYISSLLALYSKRICRIINLTQEEAKDRIIINWSVWKNILPLKDIGKDFAEMLGPMWIDQSKFSSQEKKLRRITFPSQGNYPLVDYFMLFETSNNSGSKFKRMKFSAKSKVSNMANTVKISTVMDDILKWNTVKRNDFIDQWKGTWIFELVKEGHRLVKENEKNKVGMHVVNDALRNWCLSKKIGDPSWSETQFWSKLSSIIFYRNTIKDFFADFIKSNIYYVVFDIDKQTGLPKFILDFNALSVVNVRLKDLKEQLGFDPKFRRTRFDYIGIL